MQRITTFTVQKKLLAGFTAVVLLFGGLAAYIIVEMAAINGSVLEFEEEATQVDLVNLANERLLQMNRNVLRAGAVRDAEVIDAMVTKNEERVADLRTSLEELEPMVDSDRGKAVVADYVAAAEELFGLWDRQFALMQADDYDGLTASMSGEGQTLGAAANEAQQAVVDYFNTQKNEVFAASQSSYETSRTVVIVVSLVVALVAIAIGVLISRGVATQLRRIADDLTDSASEGAAVSAQLGANAEETSAQAGVVAAASEQVSANAQTVASAVEQMSASIQEIASNTGEASTVATNASHLARATNATISKLGDSSEQIGKVIEMITSIAEQTNLLALNATIEAARAGEAGKGFAVVAGEVKELAIQTSKATEEIAGQIAAIRGDTGGAVDAIEEITAVIEQIAEIQGTISSAVEEQTATTSEISRNVADAASGSSEIARNIAGVADAAASTAEGAAAMQRSSGALTEMAAALRAMVEREAVRTRTSGPFDTDPQWRSGAPSGTRPDRERVEATA